MLIKVRSKNKNHMKSMSVTILLLASIFFATCQQTDIENNPEAPQSLIDKSLEYFDGDVLEKIQEEDVQAWKIKIQNSNGSIVNFYWTLSGEFLLKMEGLVAPFDYDIHPGNGLIIFSTAKTIAIGSIKNDALIKWELEQEEDFIDQWVYTFDFDDDGNSIKVYIDAQNGNILQVD